MTVPSPTDHLVLGHLLQAFGVDPGEVLVIRHTYTPDGIRGPHDATAERLLAYTRRQDLRPSVFPRDPAPLWLTFMADGGTRSRFLSAYRNHGEVADLRSSSTRTFDLAPSDSLQQMQDRLVIDWGRGAIKWHISGRSAAQRSVVEISDPGAVAFPGFDNVRLTHAELKTVVSDRRYTAWQTALRSVQGVYVIADTTDGQLYVGKADGRDRIFGRWSSYAADGHGGNKALRELEERSPGHCKNYVFSILRVFGPSTPSSEVDQAESHYKDALLSRRHGLNRG